MEDHTHSVFPQFQQTDRPDVCAFSLGMGKLTLLVSNTPFALIAPITFFHLFQSPEDYINRWLVASFMRCIRYLSFFLSADCFSPRFISLDTGRLVDAFLERVVIHMVSFGRTGIFDLFGSLAKSKSKDDEIFDVSEYHLWPGIFACVCGIVILFWFQLLEQNEFPGG
jgi:hypothetical protein